MTRRLAAFAVLLSLAFPSFAQSVKLPETRSGIPGQWIIVPMEIDGGTPKTRLSSGLEEINLAAFFPEVDFSKARARVVTAVRPGRYFFEAWNAKGDKASDISTCVIIVGDPPAPVPKPPDVPTDPPPVPTGKYFFMIIRPDDAAKKPYVDYLANAGWDLLRTAGHKVKDYTVTEAAAWWIKFDGPTPHVPPGTVLPCIITLSTQGANSVIVRGPIALPDPSQIVNLPPK